MPEFSVANWALYVIAVLLAYSVRGGAGFGGGVVLVPLLALLAPLQVVVPLASALNTLAAISQGFREWRKVDWREMLRILPFALSGVVVGIFFLNSIDPKPLSRSFGLFIVAYALYVIFSKGGVAEIPKRWLTPVAAVLSFCAGVIGSVFGGAAGPIFAMYFNAIRMAKDTFRASMTMLMLTLGTTRFVGYFIVGMYTAKVLFLLAVAVPLAYLGGYAGARFVRHIDQRVFNRIVGVVLLASGVALTLK